MGNNTKLCNRGHGEETQAIMREGDTMQTTDFQNGEDSKSHDKARQCEAEGCGSNSRSRDEDVSTMLRH